MYYIKITIKVCQCELGQFFSWLLLEQLIESMEFCWLSQSLEEPKIYIEYRLQ